MKQQIDPQKIFEQAECFYRAWVVLHTMFLESVSNKDIHAGVTLADPVIVLGALTTELFLKCLICIETGNIPRDHDLKKLFDKLSTGTCTRIQNLWESVVMRRTEEWDRYEEFGLKMPRDLPSALAKGSEAFKRTRYSYEENTEGLHWYLEDLPTLLEELILEMKPDYEASRKRPLPLPGASRH
jgi:hypothetical protein